MAVTSKAALELGWRPTTDRPVPRSILDWTPMRKTLARFRSTEEEEAAKGKKGKGRKKMGKTGGG